LRRKVRICRGYAESAQSVVYRHIPPYIAITAAKFRRWGEPEVLASRGLCTHDERAGAAVQGNEAVYEGDAVPERGERGDVVGYGGNVKEQRRVSAQALPYHGAHRIDPRIKLTTFQTLTGEIGTFHPLSERDMRGRGYNLLRMPIPGKWADKVHNSSAIHRPAFSCSTNVVQDSY
jgi:hypothetical protein